MKQTGPLKTLRCKLTIVISAALLFLLTINSLWAQQQSRITLSQRQMTVGQALSEIENLSDLIFTVNHSQVDVTSTIKFSRQDLTLQQALDQLTRKLGFNYRIVKNHIVLIKNDRKSQRAERKQAKTEVQPEIVDIEEPEEIVEEIVPVIPDTLRTPYSYSSSTNQELPLPGGFTNAHPGRFPGTKEQPRYAIKTNLLYGATLTPNLAFEFATGAKTTLTVSAGYNPWNVDGTFDDNDKFAHRLLQTEFRYWPCERFNRSFWGVHAFAADFNIGGHDVPMLFKKEYRYEGWGVGAGINYGYHLILKKRWSLEFTAGVGVAYLNFDRYPCDKCEQMEKNDNKLYFGPTKLGINLVFLLK